MDFLDFIFFFFIEKKEEKGFFPPFGRGRMVDMDGALSPNPTEDRARTSASIAHRCTRALGASPTDDRPKGQKTGKKNLLRG